MDRTEGICPFFILLGQICVNPDSFFVCVVPPGENTGYPVNHDRHNACSLWGQEVHCEITLVRVLFSFPSRNLTRHCGFAHPGLCWDEDFLSPFQTNLAALLLTTVGHAWTKQHTSAVVHCTHVTKCMLV